jgi:hypothetical protein
MDIDWTQIRGALSRIERQLAKAHQVIESSDAEAVRDWPEVSREELEAAFPRWREEYGSSWTRDFLDKRFGRENYRARPGCRTYRIAPQFLDAVRPRVSVHEVNER